MLAPTGSTAGDADPMIEVYESAARLQELVPEAVVVGGTASTYHAGHRLSFDHDHVVADLTQRYDLVLDALEAEGEWVTSRVAYGKIVLGSLGGIQTGVRQLIRTQPLEVETVDLPSGRTLRVPTIQECLRIKAFMVTKRNSVRDYLDVAALSATIGTEQAAQVLAHIDDFYAEKPTKPADTVAAQLLRQLSNPQPADAQNVPALGHYKGVRPPWSDWSAITGQCRAVATAMLNEMD